MNVLSLFDGMSCGRLALERAEIPVDNYYAAEIDKHAIKVAMANYPDIVQLGDVCDVMWPETFEGQKIDLLLGGSPCQGFSFAGKQLNFDDPRSKLFFEYVRILEECKPRWFLLENVRMKKESQDIISDMLGVPPVQINSSLVSAQNRVRFYWTNIPFLMPPDSGIVLNDILEEATADRDKSYCIIANYHKTGRHEYFTKKRNQLVMVGHADNIKGHGYNSRVYDPSGKAPTLCAASGGNLEPKVASEGQTWRKLTPIECERLQTVPDNYTAHVSNTQRYRMLGNGWTIDVIAHILASLKQ